MTFHEKFYFLYSLALNQVFSPELLCFYKMFPGCKFFVFTVSRRFCWVKKLFSSFLVETFSFSRIISSEFCVLKIGLVYGFTVF